MSREADERRFLAVLTNWGLGCCVAPLKGIFGNDLSCADPIATVVDVLGGDKSLKTHPPPNPPLAMSAPSTETVDPVSSAGTALSADKATRRSGSRGGGMSADMDKDGRILLLANTVGQLKRVDSAKIAISRISSGFASMWGGEQSNHNQGSGL